MAPNHRAPAPHRIEAVASLLLNTLDGAHKTLKFCSFSFIFSTLGRIMKSVAASLKHLVLKSSSKPSRCFRSSECCRCAAPLVVFRLVHPHCMMGEQRFLRRRLHQMYCGARERAAEMSAETPRPRLHSDSPVCASQSERPVTFTHDRWETSGLSQVSGPKNKINLSVCGSGNPLGTVLGSLQVRLLLPVVQVEVQNQQFGFLGAVPASCGAHEPSIGRSDPPHHAA